MPNEFVEYLPGETPLILDMPHSAIEDPDNLPPFMANNLRDSDKVRQTLRGAVDVAVPEITGFMEQESHHRVFTKIPRARLDVNRAITDVDEQSVEGRGEPNHSHGLIWSVTVPTRTNISDLNRVEDEMEDMLVRPYTENELQQMLDLGYTPYEESLRKAMDTAIDKHGKSVLLSLHTFPDRIAKKIPNGKRKNAYVLGPKATRGSLHNFMKGEMPDLIMIVNPNKDGIPQSCSTDIATIVKDVFERAGLIVSVGFGPFQGDNGATKLYADPANGRHVVGLELVSHDLEPGRAEGSLEVNTERASVLRNIYTQLFEKLS